MKRYEEMRGQTVQRSPSDCSHQNSTDMIRAVTTRMQSKSDQNKGTNPSFSNSPEVANQWCSESDRAKICKMQEHDPELTFILSALKENKRPQHTEVVAMSPGVRYLWSIWDSLVLQDGCLYRCFHHKDDSGSYLQLIVPNVLKDEILYQVHNSVLSGHLGRKKP